MILLSLLGILCCCKQNTKEPASPEADSPEVSQSEDTFDWLLGNWQRTNEEEGKDTFEFWTRTSENEYSGFGFTLQASDTIWQELMLLKKENDSWGLVINSPDDPEPVIFRLTDKSTQEATFENPEWEFPKKIRYWKSEEGIQASVSGDGMEIPFAFRRLQE